MPFSLRSDSFAGGDTLGRDVSCGNRDYLSGHTRAHSIRCAFPTQPSLSLGRAHFQSTRLGFTDVFVFVCGLDLAVAETDFKAQIAANLGGGGAIPAVCQQQLQRLVCNRS